MKPVPKIHVCGVPELEAAFKTPFTHVDLDLGP